MYCNIGEGRERERGRERGIIHFLRQIYFYQCAVGGLKVKPYMPPYHCNTITAIVQDLAGDLMVSRACNTDREPSPATTHGQKRACPPFTQRHKRNALC